MYSTSVWLSAAREPGFNFRRSGMNGLLRPSGEERQKKGCRWKPTGSRFTKKSFSKMALCQCVNAAGNRKRELLMMTLFFCIPRIERKSAPMIHVLEINRRAPPARKGERWQLRR